MFQKKRIVWQCVLLVVLLQELVSCNVSFCHKSREKGKLRIPFKHRMSVCMKKRLFLLSLIAWCHMLLAQTAVYAPRFFDGWSFSLGSGVTHPLIYSFTPTLLRPMGEVALHKQLTPSWGMGIETDLSMGDQANVRTRDHRLQVSALATLNLTRWLAGYSGQAHRFEVLLKVGGGWGHKFDPRTHYPDYLAGKMGVDFNLYLSRSRAWSIGLRPALLYDLRSGKAFEQVVLRNSQADINCLLALTYHFRNSRGGHHLAAVPLVVAPISSNNAPVIEDLQIAAQQLREDLSTKERIIADQQLRIVELESRPTSSSSAPIESSKKSSKVFSSQQRSPKAGRQLHQERISFAVGSAVIGESQFGAVERIAQCLFKNPESRVVIQGFASPDGTKEINEKMKQKRADVVRMLLIAQYGIRRERIFIMGGGVSKERISLCTVYKE